ncbi:MAG: SUMF1/EgtB/PvdO family nonheme iron enzyme [bacterium]|nr:SUMF1/EgtB/PvdO family nonheme iron enzyme [bacterium]
MKKNVLLTTLLSVLPLTSVWAMATARYVIVDIPKESATLSLSEVEVFVNGKNIAPQGKASQSNTAHNALASRAIDGNCSPSWNANTITHTPENGVEPAWELDLGADYPIEKIALWNRVEGTIGDRLNGVRVTLADAERKIVWDDSRSWDKKDGIPQTLFFVPEYGKSNRFHKHAETLAERQERLKLAALLKRTNTPALLEALDAYAEKYPEAYPEAEYEALVQEIEALEAEIKGGKQDVEIANRFRELQKRVLLKHPAVDFDQILFINRPKGTKQGLFQNYQGNTAWLGKNDEHLRGYQNSLLIGPLCQEDGEAKVLRKSSAYMGELCLDWDATKILLSSGDEKSGPWGIYEIDLDGRNWRSAFENADPLVDYYDGCYLPDGRIITTATVGFNGVPCVTGGDYVANTILIDKERKSARRLTFDQDINWNPEVYPNGRVVYLRWEYTDSAHYFSRVLMTMNPDGSDQQEFYGSNSYWPNSLFYHQHIPGSSTKFVGIVSGHHGVARKGELVMFDVAKGRIETQGAIHKFPFRGKPIENITKDMLVDDVKPYFLHPRPLNDELVLVAMQDDGASPWRIVLVDIYDNVLTLWEAPDANYYEPIPVKKLPKPYAREDIVNLEKDTCNVYMTNVYRGQKTLEGIPHGKVKKLRVWNYEYAPRHSGGHYALGMEGPWDVRILHGTVDVEEDGSCMFEFPANTPLSVQPIDENGHALQHMRSWLVGMPGETISCIGCHESQNAAAPSGQTSIASRKPPQKITPWYGEKRGWAFERELQPVLDRRCVGCHNATTTKVNQQGEKIPDFSYEKRPLWNGFSKSYIALHPYVRRNGPEGDYHVLTPLEFNVHTSDLWQRLKKGHQGVQLTAEEWDRFATWMDLNVPYFGTWSEHGSRQEYITKRREYERRMTNNLSTTTSSFDPEKIVNPYVPGAVAFEAPTGPRLDKQAPAPTLATKAPAKATDTMDVAIGGDQVLKCVRLPAGQFVMGANNETLAEAPAHVATIEKPFYIGTTEITMGMMQQFDPTFENGVYDMHYKDQVRRGYFVNNANFPAIRVSYEKAEAFCKWLSEKTGKKVRLPTETEWEYACRAGTTTPMNYGDFNTNFSKHENLADVTIKRLAVHGIDPMPIRNPDRFWDYEKKDPRSNDGVLHLAKVGSYQPNAFGLYDMHGNVAEWTSSPFVAYPNGPGCEAFDATKRVVRGGSWYQRQMRASSAWRWAYPTWQRPFDVGFRVVIEE